MNDLVLTELDTARLALKKADTIQKTKKVVDVAIAAGVLAKRQKAGKEVEKQVNAFVLEAKKQLGVQLIESPKNSGTRANGRDIGGTKMEPPSETPTLAEMGLTKKESSEAQAIATMAEESPRVFEQVLAGNLTLVKAKKKIQAEKITEARAEIAQLGKSVKPSDRWNVCHGNMETAKFEQQFDFIITDPPYPKEYLHLYETLAVRANEWLKEGGLLVAMCGQSYLDEIYAMMSRHIEYYWTAAYLTPGQPTPLRQVNVNTTWKPLLIFSKGRYTGKIFGDVFVSDGNDKSMHKWGQSESGMTSIISKMCLEGQSILDPFCGAGTTGVAALKHGCFFTGIEADQENVNIAKGRLAEL